MLSSFHWKRSIFQALQHQAFKTIDLQANKRQKNFLQTKHCAEYLLGLLLQIAHNYIQASKMQENIRKSE